MSIQTELKVHIECIDDNWLLKKMDDFDEHPFYDKKSDT